MNIAIIGAGNIGKTLGSAWTSAGHAVQYGVRAPADTKFDALRAEVGTTSVVDVAGAIDAAEVVVLAVPGAAIAEVAADHGAHLAGKIVVDTTNNMRGATLHNVDILAAQAPARFMCAPSARWVGRILPSPPSTACRSTSSTAATRRRAKSPIG